MACKSPPFACLLSLDTAREKSRAAAASLKDLKHHHPVTTIQFESSQTVASFISTPLPQLGLARSCPAPPWPAPNDPRWPWLHHHVWPRSSRNHLRFEFNAHMDRVSTSLLRFLDRITTCYHTVGFFTRLRPPDCRNADLPLCSE